MAPFWLPKCLPLGTLLALKIDQKNDPKSDCLEGRSKVAPRAPKTLPRRPPDPPRTPQEASWTPPGCPRSPPGPSRTTQNFFRIIWPNNLFRKNRKIRNRRKKVEKKVDNGHPQWLPALVLTKTKSTVKTVEHRGWRRWSREALFNNEKPEENQRLWLSQPAENRPKTAPGSPYAYLFRLALWLVCIACMCCRSPWYIISACLYCMSSLHIFIAYLRGISLLRTLITQLCTASSCTASLQIADACLYYTCVSPIFIAYLRCVSLNVCMAYLHCISL